MKISSTTKYHSIIIIVIINIVIITRNEYYCSAIRQVWFIPSADECEVCRQNCGIP